MKFTVREVLDRLPGSTLNHLCLAREISSRGPVDDRRAALARDYGRHVSHLLQDLRVTDLSRLFRREIDIDGRTYKLRNRTRYPKEDLLGLAMQVFVEEEIPEELTRTDAAFNAMEALRKFAEEGEDGEDTDEEEEEEEEEEEGEELHPELQRLLDRLEDGRWSSPRTLGKVLEVVYQQRYERLRTTRFHQLLEDLDGLGVEVAVVDGMELEPLALDADPIRLDTKVSLRLRPDDDGRDGEGEGQQFILFNPPPPTTPRVESRAVHAPAPPPAAPRPPVTVVPDPPRASLVQVAARPKDYELALLRLEFLTAVPSADRAHDPHWPEAFLDAASRGLELDDRSRRFLALAAKTFVSGSHDAVSRVVRLARVLRPDEWPLLLIDFERLNPDADPETIAITIRHAEELASLPQESVLTHAQRVQPRREEPPSFAASAKTPASKPQGTATHRDLGALKKMFDD